MMLILCARGHIYDARACIVLNNMLKYLTLKTLFWQTLFILSHKFIKIKIWMQFYVKE